MADMARCYRHAMSADYFEYAPYLAGCTSGSRRLLKRNALMRAARLIAAFHDARAMTPVKL